MQITACALQVFRVNHKALKDLFQDTQQILEKNKEGTKLRYCPTVIYGLGVEQNGNKWHKGYAGAYGGLPINEYVAVLKSIKRSVNHYFRPLKVGLIPAIMHTYLSHGVCLKVP